MTQFSQIISELTRGPDGFIRIGCDTEFEGPTTLMSQFALRQGDDIIVQLYRSPIVPTPPLGFNLDKLAPSLKRFCKNLVLRPVKAITRLKAKLCGW